MAKIKEQAEVAMNEADVILFVVDGKSGLNPLDEEFKGKNVKVKYEIV